MSKLLSALMGVSMLGAVSAASAAEPVTLTSGEMDSVTAGYGYYNNSPQNFNYASNNQTGGGFISGNNQNAQNVNNSNVQF